jgi:hypothetical protein
MIPISTHCPELFKFQAQKLRECLKRSNVDFSHSQCLETIAHLYGFEDWNTAVAKAKSETKLYIVCCTFSVETEKSIGFFQYLVRAGSCEEVMQICAKEFKNFLEKGDAFYRGTDIYVNDIVEVVDLNKSTLINLISIRTSDGSVRTLGNTLPFGTSGNKITVYQDHIEDSEEAENIPFLKLS